MTPLKCHVLFESHQMSYDNVRLMTGLTKINGENRDIDIILIYLKPTIEFQNKNFRENLSHTKPAPLHRLANAFRDPSIRLDTQA